MTPLRDDQYDRYARQIQLPEVGGRGQERLLRSRVLVVGAGGLGSPALLYLAAAGVGTLAIADGDRVERSNLGRQVIHDDGSIGRGKAEAAAERVRALNPDVSVEVLPRLEGAALRGAVARFNATLEGSDSVETKFAVNDAALAAGKPAVIGGIHRWEGQVMVVRPGGGACYRCLFETPPAPAALESCEQAGLLGPVAGVVGSLQAVECLKLLLGLEVPAGRLVCYDAAKGTFREVEVRPRPGCPCGAARSAQRAVSASPIEDWGE
ncbi:MAG: HesA/MoeB/ThiF family protein [Planctomycetales bacterium]|nr:HesA/MoeB/ThiF family protein [Planctomycetales bacterium]